MKTYRNPLFRSQETWIYAGSLAMCLLLWDTLQTRGFFILGGFYTGMYLLYLATRNCIALSDHEISIRNPFTRRMLDYPYDTLRRVEFIRDLRANPRIRLTDDSGKVRWHYLEGIRSRDYSEIIARLEKSGVVVETKRMEPYLKKEE